MASHTLGTECLSIRHILLGFKAFNILMMAISHIKDSKGKSI
ncbi:hypothetical protein XCR1_1230039 [Xenorhabdus cabanillasii JM26]|uniref:Uncharacterized protein n=1 Tax=Xenorhabdus cabanillasii JM26 TaxID=1427517 RepID=W1IPN6_9GAMM|nr:hypothetical protein XCR1_1230039 [Xenorhabdus cabanillasii JM26]